jgi:signal transduction histidine kinase
LSVGGNPDTSAPVKRAVESSAPEDSDVPRGELWHRRRSILLLRWLVIIATSYLVLFASGGRPGAAIAALLLAFLASNVVLHVVPIAWVGSTPALTGLVLVDSGAVSAALLLIPGIEGEIFILYFFLILLAAVGGSFTGIVVSAVAIAVLYVFAITGVYGWSRLLHAEVLLRVPFIFCVSIFYGYLSESARRERLRADQAELSERTKTQLISTLTHDVRNSIGAISGYTEILLDYTVDDLSPHVRELVERIQTIALESGQLISNLLEASRIEAGGLRITRQPLELAGLLKRIVQRFDALAHLKRIALRLEAGAGLPPIAADEVQIDRAFANLLGNALKFTPEGGEVVVRAAANGANVEVEVADTGPGVPPADREAIFGMYRQTEAGKKAGGAGLGLYIVRTLLDAHGARIEVGGAAPGGAVFRVTFPAVTSTRA